MNHVWRSLTRAALAGLIAFAVVLVAYWYWAGTRPIGHGVQSFVIDPGTGLSRFAEELASRSIVPEPYSLIVWARVKGYTRRIRAGEYRFDDGITLLDLLEQVVQGKVIQYPITFIEGWTFDQMIAALKDAPRLDRSLGNQSPEQIMALIGLPGRHPEGRFFPDTYLYSAGTGDKEILARAHTRMAEQVDTAWRNRPPESPLKTPDEALVLASIIEKETGQASERGLISGVFHNRLRRGMRLQTDPTVIYGLGDKFDGNLTRRHLDTDTPYNTYTRDGLPPTPIAMPGAQAIHAALHPAATPALYFVARGDGSHAFSETLAQHNRAVAKYQLRRKARPVAATADAHD